MWCSGALKSFTQSPLAHILNTYDIPDMKELKKQASMLKLLGGEVYFQQYEQKKELGRGKFGVVFQVQDKANKKIYAAKHIKTRKKEQREKVVEEIAILKKFSNPHIIR